MNHHELKHTCCGKKYVHTLASHVVSEHFSLLNCRSRPSRIQSRKHTMTALANAKGELNQFYQSCKSPLPRYDVKGSSGAFKCTVICPSIHTDEGSVELQIFIGKGPNKKASQAEAASEALKFLHKQPLYSARKPYADSLWDTVKTSLSGQVSKLFQACLPCGACCIQCCNVFSICKTLLRRFWLMLLRF